MASSGEDKPPSESMDQTQDTTKRQRTTSQGSGSGAGRARSTSPAGFLLPGVAASPPRFVSLEEVMRAANGVSNMALAHEIAVDHDFKLEKYKAPDNSLLGRVKEMTHKAFWDILKQQLESEPPDFSQALSLMTEVKQTLLSLLLPQHTSLKKEVEDKLDETVIKQQAEAGTLDFSEYSGFVLSIMSRICAPVRDDAIRELGQRATVVDVFRGIMETLELMRIDMANFAIQQVRPHIIAQSVEYEKKKFAEYLSTTNDGLLVTRQWLERNVVYDGDPATRIRDTVNAAYLEFLDWDDSTEVPETLAMDWRRLTELRLEAQQMMTAAAALLLTYSSCGQPLQAVTEFRKTLKDKLMAILADADSPEKLAELLPNVAAQCVSEVRAGLQTQGLPAATDEQLKQMADMIEQLRDPGHGLRALIRRRVREFLSTIIGSTTATPMKVPPGLSSTSAELARVGGQLLRIVSHNRAVFGAHYTEILEGAMPRLDANRAAGEAVGEATLPPQPGPAN
ncbi:T-complex protein 11-like protein 1 [Amphibalanus amphitrite]|uniref:T-complex protein 11-like protein 1 n=1 Tax=Amphibalanus amphitrite TaxID=1232801 RepID=UPI001C8FC17E|nr:T-complex protein 11-like protein 1 [Amphibalanus amphitrite]XP_043201651.1 T-complex protein 11-like protein 1 [Amphibalanus amphitrite]